MKKRRTTHNALLGSLTMMLLCFALLLGTTFAWFTDTVSSSTATIHSGNLKVALEYALQPTNGELVWQDATDSTVDLFGGANWEPGYTGVVYLRVRNTGSLSLKYQYNIEVTENTLGQTSGGDPIDLTDYIKLTAVENRDSAFSNREAAESTITESTPFIGAELPPTAEGVGKIGTVFSSTGGQLTRSNHTSKIIAVIVHMPDTVNNAANHNGINEPSISLKVNLKATQAAEESDAFGSDYDNGATYPTTPTQTQSEEGQSNEGQSGEGRPSGS